MPLAFSIYLTPHLLPTCLLHTHSRTVRGRPPPPPPELLSCGVSTLRRKLCDWALLKMQDSRGCTSRGYTSSGLTYVPPSRSILLSTIHLFLTSNAFKSTGTGSVTHSTPSNEWTNLGNNQFFRHGGRLQRPASWMAYLTPDPSRLPSSRRPGQVPHPNTQNLRD